MTNDKDLFGNVNGFGFTKPCFKENELNIEFTAITQTGPLVEKFSKKIMTEFNKQLETLNLPDRAITVEHDHTMALGRGMTNNTVIVDDGPFLSLTCNPMLTNRICMYFYWAMLQKCSLKSPNFVSRKQSVRNRIVFNYTHNTSPLMRKLHKLFIKELKHCGDPMSVLYKYVDIKNDVLDNYVISLREKNYKRFNKRFSDIKEKANKYSHKKIALCVEC